MTDDTVHRFGDRVALTEREHSLLRELRDAVLSLLDAKYPRERIWVTDAALRWIDCQLKENSVVTLRSNETNEPNSKMTQQLKN
jgi:hypothetical protein